MVSRGMLDLVRSADDAVQVSMSEPEAWRIWTDDRGLAWADPGPHRPALGDAVRDCAETLSPVGESPRLSTYWIDDLLAEMDNTEAGVIAHGNLWVLTRNGSNVEVRMDVDPIDSEPLDVVTVSDLAAALRALSEEVRSQLAAGHELDDRFWAQRNPRGA